MGGIVYSSERGRMCPTCSKPVISCICPKGGVARPGDPDDGIVRVSRETKGRRGKGVTVVSGVPLSDKDLAQLAGELKRRCGTGGTVKGGVIEVQGDHRDRIVSALEGRGWVVKRVGG